MAHPPQFLLDDAGKGYIEMGNSDEVVFLVTGDSIAEGFNKAHDNINDIVLPVKERPLYGYMPPVANDTAPADAQSIAKYWDQWLWWDQADSEWNQSATDGAFTTTATNAKTGRFAGNIYSQYSETASNSDVRPRGAVASEASKADWRNCQPYMGSIADRPYPADPNAPDISTELYSVTPLHTLAQTLYGRFQTNGEAKPINFIFLGRTSTILAKVSLTTGLAGAGFGVYSWHPDYDPADLVTTGVGPPAGTGGTTTPMYFQWWDMYCKPALDRLTFATNATPNPGLGKHAYIAGHFCMLGNNDAGVNYNTDPVYGASAEDVYEGRGLPKDTVGDSLSRFHTQLAQDLNIKYVPTVQQLPFRAEGKETNVDTAYGQMQTVINNSPHMVGLQLDLDWLGDDKTHPSVSGYAKLGRALGESWINAFLNGNSSTSMYKADAYRGFYT